MSQIFDDDTEEFEYQIWLKNPEVSILRECIRDRIKRLERLMKRPECLRRNKEEINQKIIRLRTLSENILTQLFEAKHSDEVKE